MLDINLFRTDKGGDPEIVRQSQRRRFADEGLVDLVVQLDATWRQLVYETEQLNKQLNALSKQVAKLRKTRPPEDPAVLELAQRSKAVKASIAEARRADEDAQRRRDDALRAISNIVHDDVCVSKDEADNPILREAGPRRPREPWMEAHPDVLRKLGLANLEAGQAVAGSRGYYLLGHGVLLNQALINYALQFLAARGFEPVYTPFFMTRDVMAECAQLSQFDEELYRITVDDSKSSAGTSDDGRNGSSSRGNEGASSSSRGSGSVQSHSNDADNRSSSSNKDASTNSSSNCGSRGDSSDKYLIATSEQPLCALHRQGWFDPGELPVRYAGFSTCFRREVGSHGKDTLGIFRVHQFEKVEQFCITSPDGDASSRMMEEMVGHAEDFYTSLGIPYRVVSIVSGALNKAAAKKYDLEGWFPASQVYRELVSSSNCTDYQARRLDIRLRQSQPLKGASSGGTPSGSSSSHVHMLNSTLTATQRTLSCLLENHQTREGVAVPEPLRPFMGGLDFLPFKRNMAQRATRLLRHIAK